MTVRHNLVKVGLVCAALGMGIGLWAYPGRQDSRGVNSPEAGPALPTVTRAGGGVSFRNLAVDLGSIKQPVIHYLEFENGEDIPMEVLGLRTSCHCVAVSPEKKVYAPGEKGAVAVTIDPRSQSVGRHGVWVDVSYRTSVTETVRSELTFQHRPDIVVPSSVEARVVPGRPGVVFFSLFDYREKPLEVERITSSSESVRARLVGRSKAFLPGWENRIEVTVASDAFAPGAHAERVVLHTTDPEKSTIEVKISINNVPRIRLAPQHLRVRKDSAHAGVQVGRLIIDDKEGEYVEIESIEVSHDCLTAELIPGETTDRRLIVVRVEESRVPSEGEPLTVRVRTKKPVRELLCATVVPDR